MSLLGEQNEFVAPAGGERSTRIVGPRRAIAVKGTRVSHQDQVHRASRSNPPTDDGETMFCDTSHPMSRLILVNARILTLASKLPGPRRGSAMRDLGVIERGYVVMNEGRIEVVGSGDAPTFNGDEIDVEGRVVMPAFTDCHTHACHAGERFAEAAMRLAGTPYLDILAAGGGIMSTVRSVREASHDEPGRGDPRPSAPDAHPPAPPMLRSSRATASTAQPSSRCSTQSKRLGAMISA